MKRLVLIVTLIVAFATVSAQKPSSPVMLSVADIVSNYGLDSAWVNDTVNVMTYLDSQPQDYVSLTNTCVSIRTKAQNALNSILNDYDHRDNLVWIDSLTVLTDFSIYVAALRKDDAVTAVHNGEIGPYIYLFHTLLRTKTNFGRFIAASLRPRAFSGKRCCTSSNVR